MNIKLNKYEIERFSRQIVLKDIGVLGQKKIIKSQVLIVGMGGLGCPAAEFLSRAGVGSLGIIDPDDVDLSNINRQSLFNSEDLKKSKVLAAKKKLKKINPKTDINCYKIKLNKKNCLNIIKKYDFVIDGSDNFKTKLLINDFCKKFRKFLVTGAISKFEGHIFTFDFKKIGIPCLRNFFQKEDVFENELNCEYEGVLGTVAGIVGIFQANEILKKILNIGKNLNGYILILDLLNLNFRKVKLKKFKNVS